MTEIATLKVKRSSEISLELSATIAKNSGTLPLNVKVRSWQTWPRLRRDVITPYDFHRRKGSTSRLGGRGTRR